MAGCCEYYCELLVVHKRWEICRLVEWLSAFKEGLYCKELRVPEIISCSQLVILLGGKSHFKLNRKLFLLISIHLLPFFLSCILFIPVFSSLIFFLNEWNLHIYSSDVTVLNLDVRPVSVSVKLLVCMETVWEENRFSCTVTNYIAVLIL